MYISLSQVGPTRPTSQTGRWTLAKLVTFADS
jgi:hypothetical protein